jgi:4a-hydroxytetrahydrobiopterin dehydratase
LADTLRDAFSSANRLSAQVTNLILASAPPPTVTLDCSPTYNASVDELASSLLIGQCRSLTREQAELFHAQAPDWQLAEEAHRIERSFRFRNFREALTFVREIGELAEVEGHHPNISFGWGNATVSLQTKKIKGLHENDFIMATKIDRIFARTAAA